MQAPAMESFSARERAWVALSELFRDTELQPYDFDHMAQALQEAGMDAAEAEHALLHDVAPVFGPNLLATAGNWQGWTAESVVREIKAHQARGGWPRSAGRLLGLAALRNAGYRRLLREDWLRVRERLQGRAASGPG